MEWGSYGRVLRKRWRSIVLLSLVAVLGATLLTARTQPRYQSATTFFISTPATVGDSSAAYAGVLFSRERVKSYAGLLTGEDLAEQVRADLGLPTTAGALASRISAQIKPDTVLLTATVTDSDPTRARAIASSLDRLFPALLEKLETPPGGGAPTIRAVVVQVPKSAVQVAPRARRNLALGLVLGLLLGVATALTRHRLDTTVKNPEDVRDASGMATLGAIAYSGRIAKNPLVVEGSPSSPHAEAFRQVRTNLQFVSVDQGLRSVVITSSVPNEGKSTSACNLAITLAQAGARVLLLEADLRRPRVADYLGIDGSAGLTDVLLGRFERSAVTQSWGDARLEVLPSGTLPPNPAELLGSLGMMELLRQLEQEYDLVVVDAPPLLPVTDAAVLAAISSGAILCVRAGKTSRERFLRAFEALDAVDARVLGAVLTMVPQKGPDAFAGYGGGYGYAYGPRVNRAAKSRH